MSVTSKISWCDSTWSPLVGCSRVSSGCANCYAVKEVRRLSGNPHPKIAADFAGLVERHGNGQLDWTGEVRLLEDRLTLPLRWKKPRRIFVNSMSDLFHESVPNAWIDEIFAVMALCPQHTFQILTKRAERMQSYFAINHAFLFDRIDEASTVYDACHANLDAAGRWPLPNVWLGVSVENQATADERIPWLLRTPAAVRFVSYEPALAAVDFSSFFVYNPIYENQAQRGVCLSGPDKRGPGDRSGWDNMAGPQTRLGPLATEDSESLMQEGESRARLRGVLPGTDYGRQGTDLRPGPPARVETFLRTNPRGSDREPQRRGKKEEHPEQSSISNTHRTNTSCSAHPEERQDRPAWGEKCDGEAHTPRGDGDSWTPCPGGETGKHSSRLSRELQDDLKDMPWRPLDKGDLIIVGGESGPKARPCNIAWLRSVAQQCQAVGVACWVKQVGANAYEVSEFDRAYPLKTKHKAGADPAEWPSDLQVQQMPEGRV